MAFEIKKAFAEVVTRLEDACNATGTGTYGILEGALLVEGPIEQSFTHEQMPVIIYELLNGGFVEDAAFPRCAREKMIILITVMTLAENGYYTSNRDGILDLYEKIMDVIDGSDLTGGGNWGPYSPQYRVGGVERSGLNYTFLIEVEIQTNRYQRGGLGT